MTLEEFLKKFSISKEAFAVRTGLTYQCLGHIIAGRRRCRQKTAERIELESGGRVTVMELRGEDKRIKSDGIQKP